MQQQQRLDQEARGGGAGLLGPPRLAPRKPLLRAALGPCRQSMSRVTLLHLNRKGRAKEGGGEAWLVLEGTCVGENNTNALQRGL